MNKSIIEQNLEDFISKMGHDFNQKTIEEIRADKLRDLRRKISKEAEEEMDKQLAADAAQEALDKTLKKEATIKNDIEVVIKECTKLQIQKPNNLETFIREYYDIIDDCKFSNEISATCHSRKYQYVVLDSYCADWFGKCAYPLMDMD